MRSSTFVILSVNLLDLHYCLYFCAGFTYFSIRIMKLLASILAVTACIASAAAFDESAATTMAIYAGAAYCSPTALQNWNWGTAASSAPVSSGTVHTVCEDVKHFKVLLLPRISVLQASRGAALGARRRLSACRRFPGPPAYVP